MSHRNERRRSRRAERALPRLAAAAIVAGLLGCEAVAADGDLLSDVSLDELMSLCDELRDATPGPDAAVTCADGWSATLYTPSNDTCRYLYLDECAATAGDMRACAEAVRRDPCAAIDAPPPECAPLYASVCLPWVTASPVTAECPRPEPEALRALEGVYQIVSHTLNSSSCEASGESVLGRDSEPFVVVVATENFFGEPIGRIQSCATLDSCRQEVARLRDPRALPSELVAGVAAELELAYGCPSGEPATYTARLLSPSSSGDECLLTDRMTAVSPGTDGSLRLETETWRSSSERGPDGCVYSASDRRSTSGDCTRAEAREVRFVAEL